MNIRKMFLTVAVICSCVLCAGCKNQNEGQADDDTQTIQNQDDNKQTDNTRIYEENGVRYCEESGARQKITYPLFKVTDMEWEQAGTYNMQYRTLEQDVRSGDTSYLSLQEFAWPKLYDESIVETIEYNIYNARIELAANDVQLKDRMSQKDIKIGSVSIDSAKQNTLNMIIYMEFPATTESWYMNKQSPEVRNQRLSDILNSAIIEAEVSYTDGIQKTDYYKIEADGTTKYNLYKCEGN